MEASPFRVLVVAERGEPSPVLLDLVRRRAAAGPCEVTLVVPAVAHGLHRVVDPEDQCCDEARSAIGRLLPALEEAAGAPPASRIGSHEVFAAVQDALNAEPFDEVVLCAAPRRISRLLRVDLSRKIAASGVNVTVVPAAEPPSGGRRLAA